MNPINLIAQHLDRQHLPIQVHPCKGAICAFTGQKISEGVLMKDLIKSTFTDHAYIRYSSEYASVGAALCIEAVIPTGKKKKSGKDLLNSLRSYHYFSNPKQLKLLARDEILPLVLDPPEGPYVLVFTHSNKKHTAYKAVVNSNPAQVTVTTDVANVLVDQARLAEYLPTMLKWYAVIPEKAHTAAQPTWFNKAHIGGAPINLKAIAAYPGDFESENDLLEKYRHSLDFDLILNLIQKQNAEN